MHFIALLAVLSGEGLEPCGEDIDRLIGIRASVVYTGWDKDLDLESGPGYEIDFRGVFNPRSTTRYFAGLGFAGWNAENENPSVDVDIWMYRLTGGIEVDFRTLDVGFAISTGAMYFHRTGESDDAPFLEFELSLGYKPTPYLRIGLVAIANHAYSAFNHKHNHLVHNYSVGPGVEFRF